MVDHPRSTSGSPQIAIAISGFVRHGRHFLIFVYSIIGIKGATAGGFIINKLDHNNVEPPGPPQGLNHRRKARGPPAQVQGQMSTLRSDVRANGTFPIIELVLIILVVIQGILLPILDKTTIEFLHQILNDEKESLMKVQTDPIKFPATPECRLEKMMEMIE